MGFFQNLLCVLCKSKKIKDEEIKEIEKKRKSILPFAWKYKIKCDTQKELQKNLKKTKELSEKCETLYDSAKTYQELTKQLSEKYKQ